MLSVGQETKLIPECPSQDFYCGPVILLLDERYSGTEEPYARLSKRLTYKLPITELQTRAEQSHFSNADGRRIDGNPARQQADRFLSG